MCMDYSVFLLIAIDPNLFWRPVGRYAAYDRQTETTQRL